MNITLRKWQLPLIAFALPFATWTAARVWYWALHWWFVNVLLFEDCDGLSVGVAFLVTIGMVASFFASIAWLTSDHVKVSVR